MIDLTNPAEVRREAERRQQLRARGITTFGEETLERPPSAQGHTGIGQRHHREPGSSAPRRTEVTAIGERLPNGIRLVLPVAPRTKKNGRGGAFFGIGGGPAFKRYRDRVIEFVAQLAEHLALPLPDEPMNIAAVYYVDKPGERADLTGLHQGLFDALQDANVVSDDFWFRTADGSHIVFGDPQPRVEVTITRISS